MLPVLSVRTLLDVLARSDAALAPPLRIDESIDSVLSPVVVDCTCTASAPGAIAATLERTMLLVPLPSNRRPGPAPAAEMISAPLSVRSAAWPTTTGPAVLAAVMVDRAPPSAVNVNSAFDASAEAFATTVPGSPSIRTACETVSGCSVYVPASTWTVSPSPAWASAVAIDSPGWTAYVVAAEAPAGTASSAMAVMRRARFMTVGAGEACPTPSSEAPPRTRSPSAS
jgi:hypothetical protein